ncbi:unnamed protein product [Tenebrio molitor]|nr:unnamed protein product [Tenebrio molitor]
MRKHVNYSTKNILIDRLLQHFTVGKLVAKFTETGSAHDLPRQGRPRVKEETRLDLLYLKLKKILTILQGS